MRPVVISIPIPVVNSVSATQTFTASSQSVLLNGSLSNVGRQSTQGYSPNVTFPGIQRTVTITSTGNISTSTFTITGIDTRGQAVATTLTGPNGATATTTAEFAQVNSITVGTTASSPFTVGTGATGSSIWVQGNLFMAPFAVTVAVNTVTSAPITIQDTPDDANAVVPTNIFAHSTLATVTVSAESNYAFPARYMRGIFTATSTATGASTVTFIQAGGR